MGLPHTARSDRASSRSAFPQTKGGGTGFMAPTHLMECMLAGCFKAFQGAAAALKLINGDKGAQRRHLKMVMSGQYFLEGSTDRVLFRTWPHTETF